MSNPALSFDDVVAALRQGGVAPGDVLHVQSDIGQLGMPNCPRTRSGVLDFYLGCFQAVLGPGGTLTTCTAFEDYGRFGTPFVRESSPSRSGALSEWIRTKPGAVRSRHPIVSVTALGAEAENVCGGAHYDGFSVDSPWGRLHERNALVMTFGLGRDQGGLTFIHYAERLFGVPYQYTKMYDAPVFDGGREIPGPFTMSVRYLDFGIADTSVPLKRHMVEIGLAREIPVGRSFLWVARASDIVRTVFAKLREDRWFLLDSPPRFRKGTIPFDGATGQMVYKLDRDGAHPVDRQTKEA